MHLVSKAVAVFFNALLSSLRLKNAVYAKENVLLALAHIKNVRAGYFALSLELIV